MSKNNIKEANVNVFFVPFVIITLIFVTTIFSIRIGIKNYFYDLKREEALKIVNSISISLTNTGEAVYVIDQLMDGSEINIIADKVQDLMESFKIQFILEEMMIDDAIIELSSLNSDYTITASTNKDSIGLQIKDQLIINDIKNGKIHSYINNTGKVDLFEIIVPIEYNSDKIIGFGIKYSMNGVFPVIRRSTLIASLGAVIVYVSLLFSMLVTHNKNKKLVQLAYYDAMTGLPNTEFLKQQLGQDIIKTKNNKAILMIKCDNLSLINLTYGYEYGNMTLRELGNRIKTLENKNIQLFKFLSEQFVIYIKNYVNKEELITLLENTRELFNEPFIIDSNSIHIDIKIGIMEYNKTDKSLDHLLTDATIALKYIDANENSNYSFFNEEMELSIQREEGIEKELRVAINEEDTSKIYALYQPIVDTKSKKIDCFEVLSRMNSEQFGFVSPEEFISIAEKKQLIIPLTNLILKRACIFILKLLKMGFDGISVAVNISVAYILQEDFTSTVLNIISETGINGRNLEIEITETILMDNHEIVNKKLKELRANDIRISIDDFGTGYSSLYRLRELNIDTLKIDQYFINNFTDTNKDSLITKDIISMAHRLGLKTVAEGVELQIHEDYLTEYKCDKLQGYLFSKPVLEVEAIELLKTIIFDKKI